jgi:asparagine synthase (glutamine-hydrolysing)
VSFWKFATENAVLPFLRPRLQLLLSAAPYRMPPWIATDLVRRFDLERRLPAIRLRSGPARGKFAGNVAVQLDSLPSFLERGQFGGGFEVRYPYLYRPLLELGLRLPASLRAQPYARKAVLREAMRGILPEGVRTRSGKGGIDARIVWSLSRERARVDEILREPVLAQLGCIEPGRLREAVDATREGRLAAPATLFGVLSLESWLRVRHGVWRAERRTDPRATTLAAAPV